VFYSQEERGACDSPLFSCVTLSPGLATIVFCPSFHSGFPSFFTHCGGFRSFPRFHQVLNSSYPCFAMCLRYPAKNVILFYCSIGIRYTTSTKRTSLPSLSMKSCSVIYGRLPYSVPTSKDACLHHMALFSYDVIIVDDFLINKARLFGFSLE